MPTPVLRPPAPVSPAAPRRRRGAFTLIEILLVIMLIGLLTGVLVTGISAMLNPRPESPAQAFWHAARAARKHALENAAEVRLTFATDSGDFRAFAADGTELPAILPPEGTVVEFLSGIVPPTLASNGVNATVNRLFGSIIDAADQPVAHVTFFPDGTSSLFRVRIQARGIGGTDTYESIIQVDPWTCSPMLGAGAGGTGTPSI
jgi:type II secretory pathway pseudopilin PulG